MFSFRTFPSTPRKQVWQLYPVFFCSESKHGENLKTVWFSLVFPQNVTLEMLNANLRTLQISFEVEGKVHKLCGLDKTNFDFPQKCSTSQYCSTGHKKTVWASCQTFFPQIQKQVTFIKVFKKLFSSKSLSGRVKDIFDRLTETTFAKIILGCRSKSGNDKKNLDFTKTTCPLNFFFLHMDVSSEKIA